MGIKSMNEHTKKEILDMGKICRNCDYCYCTKEDETAEDAEFWCGFEGSDLDDVNGTCAEWILCEGAE